jgi:dihydrodipicolinate synthase/N-acetylneuraminate lyase
MTEATKQLVALARKLDEAFAAGDIDRAKRIAAKQNAVLDAVMGNDEGS